MGVAGTPQDAFLALDEDSDGHVVAQDLVGHPKAINPPLTQEDAEYVIRALDADKDGKVSVIEFFGGLRAGHLNAQPASAPEAAAGGGPPQEIIHESDFVARMKKSFLSPLQAFQSMDKDHDGCIERSEFTAGTAHFAAPLDGGETTWAFNSFDVDGDEKVCENEFMGALQKGHFIRLPTAMGHEPERAYDCNQGLAHWQLEWSESQKLWCCREEQKGCPAAPPPAQPVPSTVSVAEFLRRVGQGGVAPADAFKTLDTTQDGFLDPQEFVAGTRVLTPPLTDDQAAYVFKGLDANYDNKVQASELFSGGETTSAPAAETTTPGTTAAAPTTSAATTAAASTTTAPAPMTEAVFVERMASSYLSPQEGFAAMDTQMDGCLTEAEFVAGATGFQDALTAEEASYAFSGLDATGDGRVCRQEFFGVLEVGRFFQSPADLKAAGFDLDATVVTSTLAETTAASTTQGETTAPKTAPTTTTRWAPTPQAPLPMAADGRNVSEDVFYEYRGMPAIVHGRAQITLSLSASAQLPAQSELAAAIGPPFQAALLTELGLDANVADAQIVAAGDGESVGKKAIVVLWTGTSKDGGLVQKNLYYKAASIEQGIRDKLKEANLVWMQRGSASVWATTTLSYYGPSASKLSAGTQLTQVIGEK